VSVLLRVVGVREEEPDGYFADVDEVASVGVHCVDIEAVVKRVDLPVSGDFVGGSVLPTDQQARAARDALHIIVRGQVRAIPSKGKGTF
tara:strand:+ start:7676 stop:7942 length:267 start_codon:yes stop_codon:yes gene_type:complete